MPNSWYSLRRYVLRSAVNAAVYHAFAVTARAELQIFEAIVRFVTIDVMDSLVRLEPATERLLHNNSML